MNLLDHGYVKLIDCTGSDEAVISAARMSTDASFRGWGAGQKCTSCDWSETMWTWLKDGGCCPRCDSPVTSGIGDEKLLRYLWEHGHHSPYEMAWASFEVQCPLFVAIQMRTHRTLSYNALSARYTEVDMPFHAPETWRTQASKNKQSSEGQLDVGDASIAADRLEQAYLQASNTYKDLIALGVCREQARMVLPTGQYTRMRVAGNLRNLLGYLEQRLPDNAQYEHRVYAEAMRDMLVEKFPRTMALFGEGL